LSVRDVAVCLLEIFSQVVEALLRKIEYALAPESADHLSVICGAPFTQAEEVLMVARGNVAANMRVGNAAMLINSAKAPNEIFMIFLLAFQPLEETGRANLHYCRAIAR
jgi:hypothetical protein